MTNQHSYIRVNEFFRDAVATTITEEVRREIEQEKRRPIPMCEVLGHLCDWSYLARQIVGGEYSPN